LLAADARTGAITQVGSKEWNFVGRVNWLAGNSAIVMEASENGEPRQLYEVSLPGAKARRLTGDLTAEYVWGSSVVADDGKTAVAVRRVSDSKLWAVTHDSESPRQLNVGASAGLSGIASSPDGRLVFASIASGNKALWAIRPDSGSAPRQITPDSLAAADPHVTPDGRYLVFVGKSGSRYVLYRAALDGSDLKPLSSGSTVVSPALTPDSHWVFYSKPEGAHSAGWSLWKASLENGEETLVSAEHLWPLAISPDGRQLLAISFSSPKSPNQIVLLSSATAGLIKAIPLPPVALRAADAGAPPQFTPDGTSVSYIDVQNRAENIWALPLNGGPPRQITSFRGEHIIGYAVRSNAGLIVATGTQTTEAVLLRNLR
jgi:dipeptidyl aminopeptidase/acylaminoacyl peptidase